MQRIMVIGCSGAGKSWLSAKVACAFELPLVSLDAEYWQPNWKNPEYQAWMRRVQALSAQDQWVMDGNYPGTLEIRVPRADAVIFLDLPRWRTMLGLVSRTLTNWGKVRDGMAERCPERLDFNFLRHAWQCRSIIRDGTLAAMQSLRSDQRGIVLRTRTEIDEFARDLPHSLVRAGHFNAPL